MRLIQTTQTFKLSCGMGLCIGGGQPACAVDALVEDEDGRLAFCGPVSGVPGRLASVVWPTDALPLAVFAAPLVACACLPEAVQKG